MNELINVKSRQQDILPDDALAQAVVSGSHAYAARTRVKVMNPEGELVTIPAEMVQQAFQDGYSPYGAAQAAIDDYVADNDGVLGAAKVLFGQLGDEAALGLPELVNEYKGDPLERAKWEALKKHHDLANIVGGVSGAGLSLFLGGPLWKAGSKAGEIAAKATQSAAANIASKAGVDLSQRAALNAAKNIAAKTAGGAVEGAIVTLPHAITETALGDPEAAAESLLWGGGIGALFGGTLGSAGELLSMSANAAKKGYSWLGGKPLTTENLKKSALQHGLGVSDDMIEYRLANKDRMDANLDRTSYDIADSIDEAKDRYFLEEDNAAAAFKRVDDDANRAIRADKDYLVSNKPDLDTGDEIVASLGQVKAKLGDLSDQADEALENALIKMGRGRKRQPVTWAKPQIQAEFTKAIDAIKAPGASGAITDEVQFVINKLYEMRERIKTAYPEKELTGVEMRGLIRELRSSNKSAYQGSAGGFLDPMERHLKKIAEGLSDRVKEKLNKQGFPEYAEIMSQMRTLSKNLEKMDDFFGRPERAYSTLRNYTGKRSDEITRVLQEFDSLNGTNIVGKLQKYKDARELLRKSKIEGDDEILKVMKPELYALREAKRAELEQIVTRNDAFRKLGRKTSHSAVLNQMRKNANPDTQKAIESLSALDGKQFGVDDFLSQIQDRKYNDAFDAARINGSRRVAAGGAIGAGLGSLGGAVFGPIGAAAGALAGFMVDVEGGKIAKKIIDGDSFLGPLFIEKQMKNGGSKLNKMKDVLQNMKKRATTGGRLTASPVDSVRLATILQAVNALVEPEKRKDRQEINSRVNDTLGQWVSNPDIMIDRVNTVLGPVGENGAPIAQSMAAQKSILALQYLHTHLPKPPRPKSPFAPAIKWKPSDFQIKGFEERFEAIIDPFSVIDHLENGTLTRNHMEALKTVYPALHRTMQMRVFDAMSEGDLELGYTDRLKLSLLMDMPLDQAMQDIARHQKSFLPTDPGVEQEPFQADIQISSSVKPESEIRGA